VMCWPQTGHANLQSLMNGMLWVNREIKMTPFYDTATRSFLTCE